MFCFVKGEIDSRTAAFECQIKALKAKLEDAEQAAANSNISARMDSERFTNEIQRIQLDTQERLEKQHKCSITALQNAHNQSDEKAKALENSLKTELEASKTLVTRLQTANETNLRDLAKCAEEAAALRADLDATRRELREAVRQRDAAEVTAVTARENSEQAQRGAELTRSEIRCVTEQLRRAEDARAAAEGECERERNRISRILEDLGRAQAQFEALASERDATSSDNAKANATITKLQNEIQSMRGKLKIKGVVTVQQEKLLQEKCQLLDQATQKTSQLEQECDQLTNFLNDEKFKNDEMKKQLDELQKTSDERLGSYVLN